MLALYTLFRFLYYDGHNYILIAQIGLVRIVKLRSISVVFSVYS